MRIRWRPSFWPLNIAIWTVAGVFLYFIRVALHADPMTALGLTLFQEPLAMLICGLLREAFRRFASNEEFSLRTAAILVFFSVVATLLQAGAVMLYVDFTGWWNPFWTVMEEWLLRVIFLLLLYLVWSLFYFWLRAESSAKAAGKAAAEARAEATRMELLLMRAHLNPHFLFNALNGLSTIIRKDPGAAQQMVLELADYLRYALDHRLDTVVSLSEELDAVSAYLRVERQRFGERLSVEIDVDDTTRRTKVPCFMLQPLVENAAKHCFNNDREKWELGIYARRHQSHLQLEVTNTGHLQTSTGNGDRLSPSESHEGVGLKTLHRRLEILYPDRHAFTLDEKNGVVRASLKLYGAPCSV